MQHFLFLCQWQLSYRINLAESLVDVFNRFFKWEVDRKSGVHIKIWTPEPYSNEDCVTMKNALEEENYV